MCARSSKTGLCAYIRVVSKLNLLRQAYEQILGLVCDPFLVELILGAAACFVVGGLETLQQFLEGSDNGGVNLRRHYVLGREYELAVDSCGDGGRVLFGWVIERSLCLSLVYARVMNVLASCMIRYQALSKRVQRQVRLAGKWAVGATLGSCLHSDGEKEEVGVGESRTTGL